jgi:predicted nucleotidyltransferase
MSTAGDVAIKIVARGLAELVDDVMFVGGLAGGLLINDPAAPPLRATDDVDIVADIIGSYGDEWQLSKRLRELGFAEDTSEGAPRCRWRLRNIKVDVMLATDDRWFPDALKHVETRRITDALTIKVISVPFFLATKLEAFGDGRRGDYFASRDIEDVVAVLDGRTTIEADIRAAPTRVRDFLRDRFRFLLTDPDFIDAVAGHLPGDSASQARLPIVLSRMRAIAAGP